MFSMHRYLGKSLAYVLLRRNSHSQVAAVGARTVSDIKQSNVKVAVEEEQPTLDTKKRKTLVQAAFAALKEETVSDIKTPQKVVTVETLITNAKTEEELLAAVDNIKNNEITRKQALKIMSLLSEKSSLNNKNLSDYESDPRFKKLCNILGRTVIKKGNKISLRDYQTEDLNIVMGVTEDDEAAKLISNITIPQMIKVMSNLAMKKRRSMSLLRAIAYNISGSTTKLDLKQASDLLYAMATLNFHDPVLVDRICTDVQTILPHNSEKSSVVGSILTSLSILRYRDTTTLESLADWIFKNFDRCRLQDINALFITLGKLNYPTCQDEALKKALNKISEQDMPKSIDWLNYVWSLVLLNIASPQHLESVMKRPFLEQLIIELQGVFTPSIKMKLLNINGYAKTILKDYKGSLLPQDSAAYDVPLCYSKEKQNIVNGMLDSLKSLLSLDTYVKTKVNTNFGFVIDAECCFDSKGNPVSLEKADSTCKRVAIMVHDYHDMCQGLHSSPTGLANLSTILLEKSGRHVLSIPYTEFSVSDKLLKRVQYLEGKLKTITKPVGKTK